MGLSYGWGEEARARDHTPSRPLGGVPTIFRMVGPDYRPYRQPGARG